MVSTLNQLWLELTIIIFHIFPGQSMTRLPFSEGTCIYPPNPEGIYPASPEGIYPTSPEGIYPPGANTVNLHQVTTYHTKPYSPKPYSPKLFYSFVSYLTNKMLPPLLIIIVNVIYFIAEDLDIRMHVKN